MKTIWLWECQVGEDRLASDSHFKLKERIENYYYDDDIISYRKQGKDVIWVIRNGRQEIGVIRKIAII